MDNLNARIADATFRIYHRLNPCTVVIEREGRPTARLNAIVHNSSADFNLRAKGSFPVMTRVFIVDVKDSPGLKPRRGDTLIATEKETDTRYIVAADTETPAVQTWKGYKRFLKIRCRQAGSSDV
ncbi:MAG: hypothetical protein IKE69_13850 [Thermoguttaceae bacterium]|nr:hypothetical protein [Thermoguttaceae bacterium]